MPQRTGRCRLIDGRPSKYRKQLFGWGEPMELVVRGVLHKVNQPTQPVYFGVPAGGAKAMHSSAFVVEQRSDLLWLPYLLPVEKHTPGSVLEYPPKPLFHEYCHAH